MKRMEQARSQETFNLDAQQEEAVRRRAYEIYQQRGMTDGLAFEDWLQAETELIKAHRPAAHSSPPSP